MTRKHYIKIAKAIRDNSQAKDTELIIKGSLVIDLCMIFQEDNDLFDSGRFISACSNDS